jgi:TRAP-type C4-dicarboxylate transport system substrate-binding protein
MKKTVIFAAILAVTLTWTLSALPAAAGPITLTYSNFFPPVHTQSKLAEAWCKEVEKRTNGQVVIQYFPGQTLTKGAVCYDGVVQGISDIGLSVLAYTRGRFPVMEVLDLPLGYQNGRQATAVVNDFYNKMQPKGTWRHPGDVPARPRPGSFEHPQKTGPHPGRP